jgi:hypothetical protein
MTTKMAKVATFEGSGSGHLGFVRMTIKAAKTANFMPLDLAVLMPVRSTVF